MTLYQTPGEVCLFFVLSKTVGFMVIPTNFLIGMAVIGAVLLATRWTRLGRRLMVAATVLLAICAFSPLGYLLLYPLEQRFPQWDPTRGAPDGIIVLGAPIEADLSAAYGVPVMRSAPDRIVRAAMLAHAYPNARIVYAGGSANLFFTDAREADFAATVFEGLGIAKSRLILERQSRNTLENAAFSKAMANPKPGERWLLVTSAFHMPRSVGLFRRAGFAVEPYPVDWRANNRFDPQAFTLYALEGLWRTDSAMREWIGLIAYRLTGRIDQLLPGP